MGDSFVSRNPKQQRRIMVCDILVRVSSSTRQPCVCIQNDCCVAYSKLYVHLPETWEVVPGTTVEV